MVAGLQQPASGDPGAVQRAKSLLANAAGAVALNAIAKRARRRSSARRGRCHP